jgi:homoserine kinase
MSKKIKIFSPATVANVACGFDVMGFALNSPGDELSMEINTSGKIILKDETPYGLP